MILDFNTLVKLFMKENETTLTEEELAELFKLYFEYVREEIESGRLAQVRLKYFGSFKPMFGKIKHLRKNINWDKFLPKEKKRYEELFKRLDELLQEDQEQS